MDSKRIALCMGVYCTHSGSEVLYERLTQLLGERGPAWAVTGPIRWEIANCLDMCGAGPNLLVYPDGEEYNGMNVKALEELVKRLLEESK